MWNYLTLVSNSRSSLQIDKVLHYSISVMLQSPTCMFEACEARFGYGLQSKKIQNSA
ncbi:uncharacterized protein J3R85_002315 [Psidium guajava]|nr:uncharacterized protein J3R85_002315 [Psidium guajava]